MGQDAEELRTVFRSETEADVQSRRARLEFAGLEATVSTVDGEIELLDIGWDSGHVSRPLWPIRTYLLKVPEAQAAAALDLLGRPAIEGRPVGSTSPDPGGPPAGTSPGTGLVPPVPGPNREGPSCPITSSTKREATPMAEESEAIPPIDYPPPADDLKSWTSAGTKHARPAAITVICVLMFLGAIVSIPLAMSEASSRIGAWYPPYLILASVIGFACMMGLWTMRKWGVYAYTAMVVINQVVLLVMNAWNPFSLLIPLVVVAIGFAYLAKME